jgi:hypothetical protein
MKYISEPDHKCGQIYHRNRFEQNMKDALRSEQPSISLLDESFETLYFTISFTRNLPYSEKFVTVINEMVSNGIANMFYEIHANKHQLRTQKEKIEPQVLTLGTLGLGFYSFMIATALSVLVFVIEHIFALIKGFLSRNF